VATADLGGDCDGALYTPKGATHPFHNNTYIVLVLPYAHKPWWPWPRARKWNHALPMLNIRSTSIMSLRFGKSNQELARRSGRCACVVIAGSFLQPNLTRRCWLAAVGRSSAARALGVRSHQSDRAGLLHTRVCFPGSGL